MYRKVGSGLSPFTENVNFLIMQEVIIVKYGELMLKGQNRPYFLKTLIQNIRYTLQPAGKFDIKKGHSLLYIVPENGFNMEKALDLLRKVFGVVVYHRSIRTEKDIDKVIDGINHHFKTTLQESNSFKLETRRADKEFPYTSHEINTLLGDRISKSFDNLQVDVHNPDVTIFLSIRNDGIFIYSEKFKGPGGLPVGTGGKATVLLSGGIDSPLASWLIARRGVSLEALHFYSYPYTSERSKNKVIELTRQLAQYTGRIRLQVFPFTEIQEAITENCPKDQVTIIMRRWMMRVAEILAEQNNSQALITGESLGQVASQTIEGLSVTNAAVNIPVFRPLIGMNKEEIVDSTREIGTYNISIQPYTDCCTIFVPKHPQTKPELGEIEESEKKVDFHSLIEKAIKEIDSIDIEPEYE